MGGGDGGQGQFRQIGERPRFDGSFFRVVTGTFVGPDGFMFERELVRHPGAVAIVPLEANGRSVLMIRQFRGAVGEPILELPAGKRDIPDEDPAICAGRELVEEIGQEASSLHEIGRFYNSPGYADEATILFLAEGLKPVARDAHGVEEEHLTVERILLEDVEELMASGDLCDAKSIIGLYAARSFLSSRSEEPAGGAQAGAGQAGGAHAGGRETGQAGGAQAGGPPEHA